MIVRDWVGLPAGYRVGIPWRDPGKAEWITGYWIIRRDDAGVRAREDQAAPERTPAKFAAAFEAALNRHCGTCKYEWGDAVLPVPNCPCCGSETIQPRPTPHQ